MSLPLWIAEYQQSAQERDAADAEAALQRKKGYDKIESDQTVAQLTEALSNLNFIGTAITKLCDVDRRYTQAPVDQKKSAYQTVVLWTAVTDNLLEIIRINIDSILNNPISGDFLSMADRSFLEEQLTMTQCDPEKKRLRKLLADKAWVICSVRERLEACMTGVTADEEECPLPDGDLPKPAHTFTREEKDAMQRSGWREKDKALPAIMINSLPCAIRSDRQLIDDMDAAASQTPRMKEISDKQFMRMTAHFAREAQSEDTGEYHGFIAFSFDEILREYVLETVAVLPQSQRRGVGSELVQFLIRKLEYGIKKIRVVVREHELPAQILLRENGFQRVRTIHNHFQNPQEDGYVMEFIALK